MPMVDTKEGDSDEQLQLGDFTLAFFCSVKKSLAFLRKLRNKSVEMALVFFLGHCRQSVDILYN